MRAFIAGSIAVIGLFTAQPAWAETFEEAAQCVLDNADAETKAFIGGMSRKPSNASRNAVVEKKAVNAALECEALYGWQKGQAANAMTLAGYYYNRDAELAKLRTSTANPAIVQDVPSLVAIVMRLGNGDATAEADSQRWLNRNGFATLDDFVASPYFPYFQELLSIALTIDGYGGAWK